MYRSGVQRMQFPPHDLAGTGLGYVTDELDFAWAFIGCQRFAARRDDLLLGTGRIGFQENKNLCDFPFDVVRQFAHGGKSYGRML